MEMLESDGEYEYIEAGVPVPEASLHPPVHDDDDGSPLPGSVLLDYVAYLDGQGRTNATTGYSKTRDGHRIQVTFWPARPPRISYFTACCPDLKPGNFAEEPVIMAAEDDLVLLRVVLGPQLAAYALADYDLFIYRAGAGGQPPSLKLLQHPGPSRIFADPQVGILHCRCRRRTPDTLALRPHGFKDDGFYIIAALVARPGRCYDLYTYDSRTEEWATRTAPRPQGGPHGFTTKVIVVGGKSGTLGWADLWRGILFCNLLDDGPVQLRYVALPQPINPDRTIIGCPRTARDIAVVRGRINYVELHTHVRPGSAVAGNYISDDWTLTTWFIKATTKSLEKGSWQASYKLCASQISVKNNLVQFELLPKLLDDHGMPQPTLQRLHTLHPTLSLHEGNVVYLMAKIHYINDTKGWALAIDLTKKTLQGVAQFDAQRVIGVSPPYMCCGISKYLQLAPATKGDLKRSGIPMRQSSLKKQAGFLASGSAQKHQDDEVILLSVGALDKDNMDLD